MVYCRPAGTRARKAQTPVILLIQNRDITVIHATTGEILRELTIDYQPKQPPTLASEPPQNNNVSDHR